LVVTGLAVLAICLAPSRAQAATITVGTLEWQEDPGNIFGPTTFLWSDFAVVTFSTVTLSLDATNDPGPLDLLSFPQVSGDFGTVNSATLTFTLAGPGTPIPTTILRTDLAQGPNDPFELFIAEVQFREAQQTAPVPEPSTLLLVGGGLAAAVAHRRRSRRR